MTNIELKGENVMKQQDNRKDNIQTDALTDLPVANEQADAIKGSANDIYLFQDYTNAAQNSR